MTSQCARLGMGRQYCRVLPSQSVGLRIAAPTRSIQLAVVLFYIGATPSAPSIYEVLPQSAHECTESLSTASLPCNLYVGQPATGNLTYQYAYLPARPPGVACALTSLTPKT